MTDDRIRIEIVERNNLDSCRGSTIDSSPFLTNRTDTRADRRDPTCVLHLQFNNPQNSLRGTAMGERTEGLILLRYGIRVMCFSICIGYCARTLSSAVGIPFEIRFLVFTMAKPLAPISRQAWRQLTSDKDRQRV